MTPTTSLTDRYVWTVTRHLPGDIGPDVAQELRATIADAIDGKVAGGADAAAAEEESIAELGDPDALSRQYGGRPAYLIGPGVYPEYVRLMRILPAIVLPLVLVANFVTRAVTTDDNWGAILLEAFLLLLSVAVHLGFWVTVTFAVIERARPESERDRPLNTWQPDQLTTEVPWRQVGLAESLFQAGFAALMAVLVAWQFSGVGDDAIQVLNPEVDSIWKVALIGLFVLDAVMALAVWRVGRWTPTLAAVNVASNAAAATLLIWVLARGELLTDLPAVLGERFGWSTSWSLSTPLVAAAIVAITLWDGVDSVIKARQSVKAQRIA